MAKAVMNDNRIAIDLVNRWLVIALPHSTQGQAGMCRLFMFVRFILDFLSTFLNILTCAMHRVATHKH
jgi:hypothetical protein